MFDSRHGHDEVIFVDLVKDAVHAASGRPGALERRQDQSFANAMWIFQECGGDELVDRRGDLLRQTPGQGTRCGSGYLEPVPGGPRVGHRARRDRFAINAASSSLSRTSPASTAARDSASCRMASGL